MVWYSMVRIGRGSGRWEGVWKERVSWENKNPTQDVGKNNDVQDAELETVKKRPGRF